METRWWRTVTGEHWLQIYLVQGRRRAFFLQYKNCAKKLARRLRQDGTRKVNLKEELRQGESGQASLILCLPEFKHVYLSRCWHSSNGLCLHIRSNGHSPFLCWTQFAGHPLSLSEGLPSSDLPVGSGMVWTVTTTRSPSMRDRHFFDGRSCSKRLRKTTLRGSEKC